MKRLIATVLLGLATAVAVAAPDEPATRWQEAYLAALERLGEQEYGAAAGLLDVAVNEAPTPRLRAIGEDVDYLPYLNLAAARFELGEHEAARAALERSATFGVARQSYFGRNLWDRYGLRVMAAAPSEGLEGSETVTYRDFEPSRLLLPQEEADDIKRQVLRRCALTGSDDADDLPWYFHYEFGLELLDAGDAQRAVDQLILAANKREESTRGKRMYGMWFTNYLPYYQIALAHSQLGNWRCAMDAMRISASFGEFSPADRGFEDYSDLQKLILRQNDANG